MEAQYHQFGPVSVSGTKNRVYILYSILVLLLVILLLITGVKFSQLSNDVNDIKVQLERDNSKSTFSASSSVVSQSDTIVQQVYLEKMVPVRGHCREGWASYENSCYLLSTTTETWSRAESQCQVHKGHLLVLNNKEELDYISKIVELRFSYWIGLVERHEEGHWTWVDGTNFNSTPTFWDRGQPDNWDYIENGEDCGQLHASMKRKRKLWNDADCSVSYRYICESRI